MSEKSRGRKKDGVGSVRAGRVKTFQPERRKSPRRWFSLDSLMGKTLCVLLVVILTVGAFVAPKLINSLYDAGTLMQIAYIDMDLSPYAVPYTTFQDKIKAIAGARSAGMEFTALPAEETADKISDEELIEIVNQEMGTARQNINVFFSEGWWDTQTVDNLVSREKHTVYMRALAGQEDAVQEMTPFQVWTLTFEVTQKQDELMVYDGKESKTISRFATHKLIICLDADFYRIMAFALQGERNKSEEMYGWNMIFPFGAAPDAPAYVRREAELYRTNGGMDRESQIYLASQICEEWVSYWDITLKDYFYPIENEGMLGAYLIFEDEAADAQEGSSGEEAFGTTEDTDVVIAAAEEAEAASGIIWETDLDGNTSAEVYDAEMEARDREMKALEAEGYPAEVLPSIAAGWTFLETGCKVEWEEADDNIWTLKTGCMEFFEMMQF